MIFSISVWINLIHDGGNSTSIEISAFVLQGVTIGELIGMGHGWRSTPATRI